MIRSIGRLINAQRSLEMPPSLSVVLQAVAEEEAEVVEHVGNIRVVLAYAPFMEPQRAFEAGARSFQLSQVFVYAGKVVEGGREVAVLRAERALLDGDCTLEAFAGQLELSQLVESPGVVVEINGHVHVVRTKTLL